MSGAFDRVKATKLIEKLQKKGVTGEILNVIQSWLGEREAKIRCQRRILKNSKAEQHGFSRDGLGTAPLELFF